MRAFNNSLIGKEFEKVVQEFFHKKHQLSLQLEMKVPVGVGRIKKTHKFDLGCQLPPVIVECKCNKWTEGVNSPSAKLSVWNEAMLYFIGAPKEYRKIFVAEHSIRDELSLAEHYMRRYGHLVPEDVEFWELNSRTGEGRRIDSATGISA
jgi:hypothetical protein